MLLKGLTGIVPFWAQSFPLFWNRKHYKLLWAHPHCVHCRCTRRTARQSAQPAAPTPPLETGPQVRGGGGCSGGVRRRHGECANWSQASDLDRAFQVTCDTDETEQFGCIIESVPAEQQDQHTGERKSCRTCLCLHFCAIVDSWREIWLCCVYASSLFRF